MSGPGAGHMGGAVVAVVVGEPTFSHRLWLAATWGRVRRAVSALAAPRAQASPDGQRMMPPAPTTSPSVAGPGDHAQAGDAGDARAIPPPPVRGSRATVARFETMDPCERIVEAADEVRRRVVRDLHDGAQSRLLHAVIALEPARARDDLSADVRALVEEGLAHARSAIDELRELAHGIHPAILTDRGLAAAVEALADRAPLAVRVTVPPQRFATALETAAYFVAAEALANVVKYARATTARITVTSAAAGLGVVIEDDGVGGAAPTPGGGLAGLEDRVAALGGALAIDSPPGRGTRIRAQLPLLPSP